MSFFDFIIVTGCLVGVFFAGRSHGKSERQGTVDRLNIDLARYESDLSNCGTHGWINNGRWTDA